MNWLAVAIALSLAQPHVQAPPPVRIVDTPDVHVGVRPAIIVSPEEAAAGITVRVTIDVL